MNPDLFMILIVVSAVLLFILLFLWSIYNSFISKRNQVKTDFSDIQVQVKRKADLIEKLVETTKEYAKHEKGTFEGVAQARSALDTSKGAAQTAKAENMLSQTLRSFLLSSFLSFS